MSNPPPTLVRSPVDLPMLTAGLPGIGGVIKLRNDDFIVEEIPLYPCKGEGTHTFFEIEKDGLDTPNAVRLISSRLGVHRHDIGVAGLKDAHGITRQWLSLEHVPQERIAALDVGPVRVLRTALHTNKLKIGHLRGNRFDLRIRLFDQPDNPGGPLTVHEARQRAEAIARVLAEQGIPNYFGPQRFGRRTDTHLLGRALLFKDHQTLAGILLGTSGPADTGRIAQARAAFDKGDLPAAEKLWPHPFQLQRAALRALQRAGGKMQAVSKAIDAGQRGFFISAYQSALFNYLLADRIAGGDWLRLHPGDLAMRFIGPTCFKVLDPEREQPRVLAGEIAPTAPLFGYRVSLADGPAGEAERALLEAEGLHDAIWRAAGNHRIRGDRRPLRIMPEQLEVSGGIDAHGPFVRVQVFLPKGSYATCLLSEICKVPPERAAAQLEAPSPARSNAQPVGRIIVLDDDEDAPVDLPVPDTHADP